MKYLPSAALALFLTTGNVSAETTVSPEIPTEVKFSSTDINRIVCPGTISDLIFSEEKGLTGHFSGNNAFIKFKVKDLGNGEYYYAERQSELFAICNGAVYTIIASPRDTSSVTVRLVPPADKSLRKNMERYNSLSIEKQALQLIREAYNETYPESYRITEKSEEVPKEIFSGRKFSVTLMQTADVEGTGLQLRKYLIRSETVIEITFEEKDFLDTAISPSILAIALEDHTLAQGETTQLFVVADKGKKEQQ